MSGSQTIGICDHNFNVSSSDSWVIFINSSQYSSIRQYFDELTDKLKKDNELPSLECIETLCHRFIIIYSVQKDVQRLVS